MKPCPCKDCDTRKTYAMLFDMHIWGEDCPYECEKYEERKSRKERPSMSDYKELISDLRDADQANWKRLSLDAAAAIEDLQRELNLAEIAADDNGRQVEALQAEIRESMQKCAECGENEPKRGKWVRVENGESYHYECSRCGERPLYSRYGDVVLSGVCPMCGAKMEVQE